MNSMIPSSLSKRLLLYTWLTTAIATMLFTLVAIGTDYVSDRKRILSQVNIIEKSWADSIANSVWSLDDVMLETQLKGLSQLEGVSYIHVFDSKGTIQVVGKKNPLAERTHMIELSKQDRKVGALEIQLDLGGLNSRYIGIALKTLLLQAIKASLVTLLLFYIFESTVTKHLQSLIVSIKAREDSGDESDYIIEGKETKGDEIDVLVKKLNESRSLAIETQKKLFKLNANLEEQVKQRTIELNQKNSALEESIEQLTKAQQQILAQQKVLSLNELAKALAHELRNPLNLITNSLMIIEQNLQEDDVRFQNQQHKADVDTAIDIIKNNGTRIDKLIKKMNSLYSDSNKLPTPESRQTNILNEAKKITQLFEETAQLNPHNKVQFFVHSNIQDTFADISTSDFNVILNSLLDNSVFFLNEKCAKSHPDYRPRLDVDIDQIGDFFTLTVRDNGPGISSENLDKVLDPFFTTKTGTLGSGLGLPLVADLVQKYSGQIQIKSVLDSYTAVIIQLPVQKKPS